MEVGEMRKIEDCKRKRFDVIISKNLRIEENIVEVVYNSGGCLR